MTSSRSAKKQQRIIRWFPFSSRNRGSPIPTFELCGGGEVWDLPGEKLWATVFEGGDGVDPDEEAEKIWLLETGIRKEQLLRYDKSDNFWEMGEVGPCGPCSELHIDLGEGSCPLTEEHQCAVNVEGCWRFVELWNLVFMQYQRFPDKHLELLPAQHVDGKALGALLRDGDASLDRDALYWHFPHYQREGSRPASAIRSGDYKLIVNYHYEDVELFNLKEDPQEMKNLASQLPEKTKALREKLDGYLKETGA